MRCVCAYMCREVTKKLVYSDCYDDGGETDGEAVPDKMKHRGKKGIP